MGKGKENPSVRVTETEVVITLPRATSANAMGGEPGPTELPGRGSHAPDFSSVVWRGQTFTFSKKQRLVIAALWRAREEGYRYLSSDVLLDVAESDGGKLRNLFAKHPAWGTLVLPAVAESGTPGTYRLADE